MPENVCFPLVTTRDLNIVLWVVITTFLNFSSHTLNLFLCIPFFLVFPLPMPSEKYLAIDWQPTHFLDRYVGLCK